MLSVERQLQGKRILVTGHTGFTGSWTCLWLHAIGAQVHGLSLAPSTSPSLYEEFGDIEGVDSTFGDIRDPALVAHTVSRVRPELILHLAAQPLVRLSYREPLETFATNAMGTAHVLEAARCDGNVRGVVCVTTDKVYRNNEWAWPYRENDPLGGKDPYSASKAAAEMIIEGYAASFGRIDGSGLAIATARGGNIVGGGDWSADRLIPDYVRAVTTGSRLVLRYPDATRPWQHVLALVQGYLQLMAGLLASPARHARAWNLGPREARQFSVRDVVGILAGTWTQANVELMDAPLPEAGALALDSSLAQNRLDWNPPWDTRRTLVETAAWYRDFHAGAPAQTLCLAQLESWRAALRDDTIR